MTNEETQQLTIAALVERVMALETWREKVVRLGQRHTQVVSRTASWFRRLPKLGVPFSLTKNGGQWKKQAVFSAAAAMDWR
jgi:hypothetical protein